MRPQVGGLRIALDAFGHHPAAEPVRQFRGGAQHFEGDRAAVNALYHRILQDERHSETAILDFSEITHRQFTGWSMGLLQSLDTNRQLFLKYSSSAEFDPYSMSTVSLRGFFAEVLQNVRWLD